MGEQQKQVIPERVEDFLDHYDSVGVHKMCFLKKRPITIENMRTILIHGIVSPALKAKLEAGLGKKMFEMPNDANPKEKRILATLFTKSLAKLFSHLHLKDYFLQVSTGRYALPAIVFSKDSYFYGSERRIQPRFIIGVVLPEQEQSVRKDWLSKLTEFGKPIYDHSGQLVWKPETKEK
jgi:hypothetical protein